MTDEMKPRFGPDGHVVAWMPDRVWNALVTHPRVVAAVAQKIEAEQAHRRHMASAWYRQQKSGKRY